MSLRESLQEYKQAVQECKQSLQEYKQALEEANGRIRFAKNRISYLEIEVSDANILRQENTELKKTVGKLTERIDEYSALEKYLRNQLKISQGKIESLTVIREFEECSIQEK